MISEAKMQPDTCQPKETCTFLFHGMYVTRHFNLMSIYIYTYVVVSNIFYFHPYLEDTHFDDHIFQRG